MMRRASAPPSWSLGCSPFGVPVCGVDLGRREEEMAETRVRDAINDIDARLVVADAWRIVAGMADLHARRDWFAACQLPRAARSDLAALANASVSGGKPSTAPLPAIAGCIDARPELLRSHALAGLIALPGAVHGFARNLRRVSQDEGTALGTRDRAAFLWGALPSLIRALANSAAKVSWVPSDLRRLAGKCLAALGAGNRLTDRGRLGMHSNLQRWGVTPPDGSTRRGGIPILPHIHAEITRSLS